MWHLNSSSVSPCKGICRFYPDPVFGVKACAVQEIAQGRGALLRKDRQEVAWLVSQPGVPQVQLDVPRVLEVILRCDPLILQHPCHVGPPRAIDCTGVLWKLNRA